MRAKRLYCFFLCIVLFFCSSCNSKSRSNKIEKNFFAMDTAMSFKLYGSCSDDDLNKISDEIILTINSIDKEFSSYIENSQTYNINHRTQNICEISPEMYEILAKAQDIATLSCGAFDYTLGTLINLWDVKNKTVIPDQNLICDVLEHTGYKKTSVDYDCTEEKYYFYCSDSKLQIDLGAVIKGYAADKVYQICLDYNVYGLISIGGNITAIGNKENGKGWEIGIRDPMGTQSDYITTITLYGGMNTSTSGNYERFFYYEGVKYHHILNRLTGYPAKSKLTSVTVTGPSGVMCDMLSTACFVLGYEDSKKFLENYENKYTAVFINNFGDVMI